MSDSKSRLFEEFARVGRALSSPARLALLDLLAQGEKHVERLAEQSGLGIKNASAHLRRLREVSLVETRREGVRILYRLVRDYYESRDDLEAVDGPELLRLLRTDQVTILDVRPEDEYRVGHIPGARSAPVEELEARIAELDSGRDVVAYCRGPYCVFAFEAIELLRAHGFRARRLARGFPDWRDQGFPVETEAAA
ncbi:MAG: ArsR/SmtB family transcription factor [Gemmatimonadota bacterium]